MKKLFLAIPLLLTLLSASAYADTPITKCWTKASGKTCIGPAAAVSVFDYNIANKKISAGSLSAGYALSVADGVFSAGMYLNTEIGSGVVNKIEPAVLFGFFKDIYIGPKLHAGDDGTWWSIIGALGTQF